MAAWLERHTPDLESISLDIAEVYLDNSITPRLLGVKHSRAKLQTLEILGFKGCIPEYPLSSLTNLSSLHLDGVDLFDTTLGSSLLLLTQLRRLNLEDVEIEGEAAATVMQGVARSLLHLTRLDLIRCWDIHPQVLLPLTALHELEELSLPEVTFEASELAVLKQLPINCIDIFVRPGDVEVVGSWLKAIGAKVDSLCLNSGGLPLSEVEQLMSHLCTSAPRLRDLSVWDMAQLGRSTGLAGLTQLTSLDVRWCGMDDAALLRLSALTGLQELRLYGNLEITGAGGSLECLASSLLQLTKLGVSGAAQEAVRQAFKSRVLSCDLPTFTLRPLVQLVQSSEP